MTLDLDLCRWLAAAEITRRVRAGIPVPERLRSHWQSLDALADDGQTEEPISSRWISVRELANRLGVSERTARRLAPALQGKQIGRAWIVPLDSVDGN